MITAAATACATKNSIAAIRPSDVDTRGGGEASGSSRYPSWSRAFCQSAAASSIDSTMKMSRCTGCGVTMA
jgi:hypothetical protein